MRENEAPGVCVGSELDSEKLDFNHWSLVLSGDKLSAGLAGLSPRALLECVLKEIFISRAIRLYGN